MSKPKSILITRSLSEVPLLEAFCAEHQIRLTAESFISFLPVDAEVPSNMDVIFFGSRRAVNFFLLQSEIPAECKIACIGATTAAYIQKLGYTVDFAGTKSGDPESVAEEMKNWMNGRKLHIALSEQSNRSMSKALPEHQTEEIIVYRTNPVNKKITESFDTAIFTSPSNLNGFLNQNSINGGTKIISWGKTTEKSLNENHYKADFVLDDSSETELISILKTLI